MNQEEQQRPLAVEKWWHRLLRILGYGLTIIIFAFSFLILVNDAYYYTYSYSFQPNYENSPGDELKCYGYETLGSINCGEFEDGAEFIKFFLSVKGNDKLKDGKGTINDLFSDLRAKKSDSIIAVELIQAKNYSYRLQKHWDLKKIVISTGATLGITLGTFLLLFVLYKVILFVVYGHTRVVKG